MTISEALQASIEYQNANLFAKVLTDRGLTGTATYSAEHKQAVDLALADIYLYLATHPEAREGAWAVKYDTSRLLAARREIYNLHGLTPPEATNATTGVQSIDGARIW